LKKQSFLEAYETHSHSYQRQNTIMEAADALIRQNKYEEAVEAYGKLLEQAVQRHGPMDKGCALAYFKYGNALLLQAEAQADVFGDALKSGETANQGTSDTAELLEISWECLESARVVLTKAEDAAASADQLLLAKTHQRLGDHSNETGQFDQAVGDYERCLFIRQNIVPGSSRLHADAHYSLAEALSNAKKKEKAMFHFKKTADILQKCLKMALSKGESKVKTASEDATVGDKRKRDDLDEKVREASNAEAEELRRLILDVEAKIEEFEQAKDIKATAVENASVKVPASKIGKDDAASCTTTIGFGGAKAKAALSAKSTNTLLVRRKKQKTDSKA